MLLLVVFVFGGQIVAQGDGVLDDAADAYDAGDYATAIMLYEEVINAGVRDFAVFYNIGNAYYQSGDLGRALYHYRQAQELDPRSELLNIAIARVRFERVDYLGNETAFIDSLASSTTAILTMNELLSIMLLLWSLWFVMLFLWTIRRGWRENLRVPLILIGLIMLVGLVLTATRAYADSARPVAVLVGQSAQVMSGPGDDYLPLYRLFPAAEMRVTDIQGRWAKFILPDGRQGWVLRELVLLL